MLNKKVTEKELELFLAKPVNNLTFMPNHSMMVMMAKELVELRKKAFPSELVAALQAALEWIDAVPEETILPTMPGFDRDWVDSVLNKAQGDNT